MRDSEFYGRKSALLNRNIDNVFQAVRVLSETILLLAQVIQEKDDLGQYLKVMAPGPE